MANPHKYALEPAAQAFCEATSTPPFLFELAPAEGRAAVERVQDAAIAKPAVDEEWIEVDAPRAPRGTVRVRILRPKGATGTLPVVLYTHGAGWVFGSAHTHDRLARDLCVGTGAALVFPEYTRAPDARYPVQNEESYAAAAWVARHGADKGLDAGRMAVAGDSVGGNMAVALSLMAAQRADSDGDGVAFRAAVLFYPVTDAAFDTPSYAEFATGYFLARDGMRWFWDQYIPPGPGPESEARRSEPTASPLRAPESMLRTLPPTLVITAECDVLRDQGEAFAARLRGAGVDVTAVRYGGIIHDFVMVNSMHDTNAARSAVRQAVVFIKDAISGDSGDGGDK